MKICILCKDEDVVAARENSRQVFNTDPKELSLPFLFKKDKVIQDFLAIPTSETGELPTTHWFCFMNTNEESYQKIVNNSLYSIIEEAGPKEFLEKWNLKIIK